MATSANHSFNPNQGISKSQQTSAALNHMSSPMYGVTDTSSLALASMASFPIIGSFFKGAAKHQQDRYDKQWQEYMTRLGYAFADDQRIRQNLWNYGVSKYFMDAQNEWNSYENQSKEMRKAGLNPAMMFGQGQLSGNNSSQSAPTGGYSTSGIASQGSLASSIDSPDFAQSLKALGEAKKLGIETDYLEQSLKYKLMSDDANARYQQSLANLQEKYGDKKSAAELSKIDKEVKYLAEQIDYLIKQEGLVDEQTLTQMYETFIKKAEYLEKERLYNAKDALEDYWNNFVIAELVRLENEGLLAGVQAKWLPRQVKAQETSSYASLVGVYSQSEVNRAVKNLTDKQKELLGYEIDKVRKDAGLSKIVEDMNDNEVVQFLIRSKYLVNQIPVLGNVLDALGSEGGKQAAKKFIK